MLDAMFVAALVLGAIVWRLGLPPLVGFLFSGFLFGALGVESNELLEEISHAGVLLLLFAVGLKLRLKTLFQLEVWGTAVVHAALVAAAAGALLMAAVDYAAGIIALLAVTFSFSSTVLAAKSLDTQHELRAAHGRVAIGILIVQDLVAVILLALISVRTPSPYALVLLLVPLARPAAHWLLDFVGHGELLVLFGAAAAIVIGGAGFELLGLSAELGALVLGVLLASHRRAEELSDALWGLKEFLLVGFFLTIGLSGAPTLVTIERAGWLLLFLPLKAALLFALLVAFGLRARTSFLTTLSLATYSEFAIIVVDAAAGGGLLDPDWLIAVALAVAVSFAIAAPLNAHAHALYGVLRHWLDRWEREVRHPDDEPVSFGSAEILIVGMGRLGTGAYDYFHEHGAHVVGTDNDPGKLERHLKAGRRVVYADAEDISFWQSLSLDRLRAIMLAFPDPSPKRVAGRELRRRGYTGLLSATHV
ncbi:MAG TPA: cation:proton antiporter, partial [Gammaproteobacteria bacterium]|nr:cation:proton antiporter [Gammaproteobacteria bacterium]